MNLRQLFFRLCLLSFLVSSRPLLAQPNQDFQLRFQHAKTAYSNDLADVDFSAGITLEGWFQFDGDFQNKIFLGYGELDQTGSLGFGSAYILRFDTGGEGRLAATVLIENDVGQGVENIQSASALPLDTWLHIAMTYDNELLALYLDGERVALKDAPGRLGELDGEFRIGERYSNGFSGYSRGVRIWNRGLTEEEVMEAYNGSVSVDAAGLMAQWRLNRGMGGLDYDDVGAYSLFLGQEKIREVSFLEPAWIFTEPFFSIDDTAVQSVQDGDANGFLGSVLAWGVADFNQDGMEDFVIGGPESFTDEKPVPFRIFVNDGNGGFIDGTAEIYAGDVPRAQHTTGRTLVVADLNGDSFADIFSANTGIDTYPYPREHDTLILSNVSLEKLEDKSTTILAPVCSLRTPQFSGQRACAIDADGDYYPDMNAPMAMPDAGFGHSVDAGDIDGDGDLDIYVGNMATPGKSPHAYFLVNDGEGHFIVDWQKTPGVRNKTTTKMDDFNDDGHIDLLVGALGDLENNPEDGRTNYIFWGDGSGNFSFDDYFEIVDLAGFSQLPTPPVAVDVDNDQDKDIIITRTSYENYYAGRYIQVLENLGNRQFRDISEQAFPDQETDAPWVTSMSAINFNADDCPDIRLTSDSAFFPVADTVLLGDCRGGLTPVPNAVLGYKGFMIPIDHDADGVEEYVMTNRKLKSYGDNPSTWIHEFALLEKLRDPTLAAIFAYQFCDNCPEETDYLLGLDVIAAATTNGTASSARFAGRVSHYGNDIITGEISADDNVSIVIKVAPAEADIGKNGQFFVASQTVVDGKLAFNYLDETGNWQPWNLKVSGLGAATPVAPLQNTTLSVVEGLLAPGSYKYFAAYVTAGGNVLTYSRSAVKLKVNE